MKKIIFLLILFPVFINAQTWKKYNLDDRVSVTAPAKIDTVLKDGLPLYRGRFSQGVMLFCSFSCEPSNDLKSCYSGFIKGYLDANNGELLDSSEIKIQQLTGERFRVRIASNESRLISDVIVLYHDGRIYNFQYTEKDSAYDIKNSEKEYFFNSIYYQDAPRSEAKIKSPNKNISPYSLGYKLGYFGAFLFIIVLFLGGALTIILIVIKKTRRKN